MDRYVVCGVVDTRRAEIGRPLICDLRRYVCTYKRDRVLRTKERIEQKGRICFQARGSRVADSTVIRRTRSFSRTLERCPQALDCKNRLKTARHSARKWPGTTKKQPSFPSSLITDREIHCCIICVTEFLCNSSNDEIVRAW